MTTDLYEARVLAVIRSDIVSLGLYDTKGREIGARILIRKIDWVKVENRCGYRNKVEGKEEYSLNVHATRDGKTYGALQNNRYFDSLSECEAALEKYLKGARKRAEKK